MPIRCRHLIRHSVINRCRQQYAACKQEKHDRGLHASPMHELQLTAGLLIKQIPGLTDPVFAIDSAVEAL